MLPIEVVGIRPTLPSPRSMILQTSTIATSMSRRLAMKP
ncbi:hypothetical protein EVA_13002 [gut metagenome]|uniref:Uncharacterized protein n=1 Tax=gut metagenome TaxID=749906 RepID=J9FWH5_9ZZZZ